MAVYAIITFHSTHFALKAKRVLKTYGMQPEMIPLPREFSSDCGICCKLSWDEKDQAEEILKKNHVEINQIFRWER